MFCPNLKCGNPLSISTECESCGWKAPSVKTAKPLPFQVAKDEKAAKRAARRAESDAHKAERKASRIEGEILEVTKEQVEGGRSYDKKTVVTMTDGRKYELDARFPSMNDARTAELVESFSELDWVCVKDADKEVEEEVGEKIHVKVTGQTYGKTLRHGSATSWGVSPLGVDTFEASGTEEEVAEAYEAWCTEGAPYTYKVYGQTNLHFRRAFARTPIKNAIALNQEERRLLDFLYTVNHRDAVKVKDEYARELKTLVHRGYAFLTEDGAAFAKLYW